jgi:hypothetical protein
MEKEPEDANEDEDMREVRSLEMERREGVVYNTNSDIGEEEKKATKKAEKEGEEVDGWRMRGKSSYLPSSCPHHRP